MYPIRDDVPRATVESFVEILRGCGRYIPELLHSVAGWNESEAGVHLVWEHAYADADAYAVYMRHPYHICVLDRFLLPDAPGRITGNGPVGLGLLGYEISNETFVRVSGVRRLVAFRVSAAAGDERVAALVRELEGAASGPGGPALSIAAPNEMGQEWFPGVFSHVWELAFEDRAAMDDWCGRESPLDAAEREGQVEESVAVHYAVHAPVEVD